MDEDANTGVTIATLAPLRAGWIGPAGLGITALGQGWLDPTAPVAAQPSPAQPIRVMSYPGAWEVLLTGPGLLSVVEHPPAHWLTAFVRGPRLSGPADSGG